jgi:hypothetical protein
MVDEITITKADIPNPSDETLDSIKRTLTGCNGFMVLAEHGERAGVMIHDLEPASIAAMIMETLMREPEIAGILMLMMADKVTGADVLGLLFGNMPPQPT